MTEQSGPLLAPQEDDLDIETTSAAPERKPLPPGQWMKENLFSSVGNTILTVLFAAFMIGVLRWLLGLVFSDESNWASVATNTRLLMSYNYPIEQYIRIWFTVGTLFGAIGLSLGAWNVRPRLTVRRIGTTIFVTGLILLVVGALMPSHAPQTLRMVALIAGVVIGGVGAAMRFGIPDPHLKVISFPKLLVAHAAVVVIALWTVPLGRYEFVDGAVSVQPGTVNETTKTPWTVMMLILVGTYFLSRLIANGRVGSWLRTALAVFWVIGPAFLIFLVLRDPAFDMASVVREDIPIAAAFSISGALLLFAISKPGREDLAKAVGALIMLVAIGNFVAGFFGWYGMLQKIRISFVLLALFALLAPTFSGERSNRLKLAGIWFGLMVLMHWLITGINTPMTLEIQAPPFMGGFVLTIGISYYVMLASFPLGILLALARTSKMPIFRVLSTMYIEFIRGIPLITVLFFFSLMLPLFLPDGMGISDLAAIFVGYTLFSAAYMAENIRGGLQAVRKGQFEAADALGLTTVQRTGFIVLPQALRVSIPNLVGQAIATFKETSLIAVVGGFDLLRIADKTIPAQADFLGQKRPALLFICLIYWVFAYAMSRASRNLEQKLGVGQGR